MRCRECQKEDRLANLFRPCLCEVPVLRWSHQECLRGEPSCALCGYEFRWTHVPAGVSGRFFALYEYLQFRLPYLLQLPSALVSLCLRGFVHLQEGAGSSCLHPHCMLLRLLALYIIVQVGYLAVRLMMWAASMESIRTLEVSPGIDSIGSVFFIVMVHSLTASALTALLGAAPTFEYIILYPTVALFFSLGSLVFTATARSLLFFLRIPSSDLVGGGHFVGINFLLLLVSAIIIFTAIHLVRLLIEDLEVWLRTHRPRRLRSVNFF